MRVSVTYGYDYRHGRSMTRYEPGEYTVKREWGEEMVARGVAVEVDPPKREPAPKK